MIRRILPFALCLALVGLLAPGPVRAADGWSVSASTNLVQADFISTSGSQAQLYMEDHVSIEPFNIPEATAVLDALGFGGGYSQEVSWGSGAGPAVSCPKGLTNLFSFCSTDTNGGWALIPDGLRTELSLSTSTSGSRSLDVRPGVRSLAYDGTVAAIGIALETLSPGPVGSNAAQVASLAIQLLPEAAGFEAAMERKDYTAAGFELLSLSKRAMTIIADHITDWAIGGIIDLVPGLAEVKLGIAVSKAIVVLANLDAHLLAGNSATTVTVGYGGGGGAVVTPTPFVTPTPGLAILPTPTPKPGTFNPTGSMTTGRGSETATLLPDGRVLIAGGDNAGTAELYDPTTGTFSPTGSMTTPRYNHTATLLSNGLVLVAGGCQPDASGGCKALASAELYNPRTGRFSPTGAMAVLRAQQTATLLSDGRILIAGGADNSGALASAELYDAKTGMFRPTGSMTTARFSGTATLLSDGRVLLLGGADGTVWFSSAELYNPKAGMFTPAGSMTTARASHTATLLADGRALIVGGFAMPSGYIATAELYDPKNGSFSMTGSMSLTRSDQIATRLQDGRVLIAAGQHDGGPVASAELYDQATGTFSPTGSMATKREFPVATLLSNGRVLVVGGYPDTPESLTSAELYTP